MKKIKLEVLNINEDVISTSGVVALCSNHKDHYKIVNASKEDTSMVPEVKTYHWFSQNHDDGLYYTYSDGSWKKHDTYTMNHNAAGIGDSIISGIEVGDTGWYVDTSGTWTLCNGNHDFPNN